MISVGDTNVGQHLVAGGWAWHYKQSRSDQMLARLESQAKSAGSGLWADANPLPPWDFRSRQRSGSGSAERPSKSLIGKRSPAQPPAALLQQLFPEMLDSTRKVCNTALRAIFRYAEMVSV